MYRTPRPMDPQMEKQINGEAPMINAEKKYINSTERCMLTAIKGCCIVFMFALPLMMNPV